MKTLLSLLTFCFLATAAVHAESGWEENYDKALAQAKTEKKMVLLDFTGSDWCGWCIRLNKEVFSKQKFKTYAKENLVLVELDYPQGKRQSDKLKEQNAKLQKQYKIEGYPTIIILDSEGKKIGTLGYMEGGPDAFIAAIEKLKS